MKYLMLADIKLGINFNEYEHYVNNVYLGIESFNNLEKAEERAMELLKDLAEDDCSISMFDSVIKCSPLNNLGNITAPHNIPI